MIVLDRWDISFPNGRNYSAQAGVLGMGQAPDNLTNPSLLKQMKVAGIITSMFCGLHIGSAPFKQHGSMILGGYDQSRVLQEVGTFSLGPVGPLVSINDVFLGVESGLSPFAQPNNISLWHGFDEDGAREVIVNPSVPYMFLPVAVCEAAAQYLPLTWNRGLGLYTWNPGDQFSRLVGSPGFMAIVLADNNAENITIKVPLQLLNLTMSPPIVDTVTQYFPCRPTDVARDYTLGRAFLQAAFLGFEFEHNLTFIAQAPGPTMEKSAIKVYQSFDTSVTPHPSGTYRSSWERSWKVLHGNTTNTSQPTSPSTSNEGLSGGATTGVVVGSVLGALGLVAAAATVWRKKKRIGHNTTARTHDATMAPPLSDQSLGTSENPAELARGKPSELYGNAPPHEMAGQNRVEAPNQLDYPELPIGRVS